jgi:hypothetical protein
MQYIRNMTDLCDYFSADSVGMLNKNIYRGTNCGASISVQTPDGVWHHNGQDWSAIDEIKAFTIQTIVEGSDATVNSEPFVLSVACEDVDKWIKEMEEQAAALWDDANNAMCECDHRSDKHAWREVPNPTVAGQVDGYECLETGCDCKKFKEDEWYGV